MFRVEESESMLQRLALAMAVALVSLIPGLATAQISHGGTPPSLDPAIAPTLTAGPPVAVMPWVDVAALRAEDEAAAGRKDVVWRFGQRIHVDLDCDHDGVWDTLPSGDRVWRLGISSPGAVSLNLAFDRYVLPPGGELYVRSADGGAVLGAFTDANNKADGKFATTLIAADEIVLEYLEPAAAPFPGEIGLIFVTHGYRGAADHARGLNDSGACNHNVYCPPLTTGWEDQVRSVVMLVSGNSGFCTGALINNTASDGTPYFLTANHCYSNPSYWVMWFNWESPDCNNPQTSPAHDSISGASLVARDYSSDFALLELSSAPPAAYGVYYSGWDNSGATPQEATCIHHPSGDIKKFTYESSQIGPDGNSFWEVGPWDEGTTEGGSSGSPLFDQDHRIVGQLFGGSAACAGQNPNNGTDTYGALSASWDGAQPDERLRDWLDPGNSGVTALDGYDPNAPLTEDDAGVLSITDPGDGTLYCSTPIPFEVVLKNYGSDPLTAVDLQWRVDGGNWALQAWSGNLATGGTTSVALPDLNVGAGVHDVEVETLNPNGVADGNPANDGATSSFEVAGASGVPGPLVEGFEGNTFPPSGWGLDNPDGAEAWERTTDAGGWGLSAASARFDNYDEEHPGAEDTLLMPMIDLSSMTPPLALEFDRAYARYDNQYYDELAVAVSVDCGQSFDVLFDESGSGLATTGDVPDWFVPDPGEWSTESLDLSAYAGEPNALVAFVNVSGWGNNLYLDNVVIHGAASPDDQDGDGYTVADGDCDDADASAHPNAPEDCGDGVDNDCDGDVDGDDTDCAGDDDASDDDAGDDDAGDDDASDDDASDDDASDDDGAPTVIGGQNCSCRQSPAPSTGAPALAAWLALVAAGALRLRRRQ